MDARGTSDVGTVPDAMADACAGPPAPALVWPWNGARTGSLHADQARLTLRPQFRWSVVEGATRYELQADDSCGNDPQCAWPSPELDASTDRVELRPTEDLAVQQAQPVGARYRWRVRACYDCGCGPWSGDRYVDVGRVPTDFNGDGYSDVAVGAPATFVQRGAVFVFWGAPDPSNGVPLTLTPNLDEGVEERFVSFGAAVAPLDVNGDGFTDLAVSAPHVNLAQGAVYFYVGGQAGLAIDSGPIDPSPGERNAFGYTIASAGDVDGDGTEDLAVGAADRDVSGNTDVGNVQVYRGRDQGPAWGAFATLQNPTAQPTSFFGASMAAAGDLDDDGFSDLVVAAHGWDDPGGPLSTELFRGYGRAFVYRGGQEGPAEEPSATLASASGAAGATFGYSMAGSDTDGDGHSDLLIGAYHEKMDEAEEAGAAYLYGGVPDAEMTVLRQTLFVPEANALFGVSVASAGDLNLDGLGDLIVGAPGAGLTGLAYVFQSTEGGQLGASVLDPGGQVGSLFGLNVSGAGDVNGDGYPDVIVGAPFFDLAGAADTNEGAAYLFLGSEAGFSSPIRYSPALVVVQGRFGTAVALLTCGGLPRC